MTNCRHASSQHLGYRLTCDDYDDLWEHAKGRCELCGKKPEETPVGKLFIDHAQEYGFFAVRGLLCGKCNTHMGFVDRGEKTHPLAIRYRTNAWFVRVLRAKHAATVLQRREERKAARRRDVPVVPPSATA